MRGLRAAGLSCLGLFLTVVALFAVGILRAWISDRRTRRAARAVPPAVRRQVLELIDRAGAEDGTPQILLVRDTESPVPTTGAAPLAEICLESPPLPSPWADRVIHLRRLGDEVRVDQIDSVPPRPLEERARSSARGESLLHVRLPRVPAASRSEEDEPPYDSEVLIRRLPALRRLLAPYTATPQDLLGNLLVPDLRGGTLDTADVSLIGGEPELIQTEHEATCSRCSRSMRFLVQLGSVLGLRGDGPVVYLYGCDEHTDSVALFEDMS